MLGIQTKNLPSDIVVLEATGRITMGRECKELEWAVAKLVKENHKKIIFDLNAIDRMDSTGIGIIVMCAGQVKAAGGELRVACGEGHVADVMRMTAVDKILVWRPTAAEASAGF
jgi:anti-sigma B factor antagonist